MGADFEGTAVSALWATDRYHREGNHWTGGFGYHMVAADGVVVLGGSLDTSRANVANRNDTCIGILWPRNGSALVPTERDLDALRAAIALAKEAAPRAVVVGHGDLPGAATSCPGARWLEWRTRLNRTQLIAS